MDDVEKIWDGAREKSSEYWWKFNHWVSYIKSELELRLDFSSRRCTFCCLYKNKQPALGTLSSSSLFMHEAHYFYELYADIHIVQRIKAQASLARSYYASGKLYSALCKIGKKMPLESWKGQVEEDLEYLGDFGWRQLAQERKTWRRMLSAN